MVLRRPGQEAPVAVRPHSAERAARDSAAATNRRSASGSLEPAAAPQRRRATDASSAAGRSASPVEPPASAAGPAASRVARPRRDERRLRRPDPPMAGHHRHHRHPDGRPPKRQARGTPGPVTCMQRKAASMGSPLGKVRTETGDLRSPAPAGSAHLLDGAGGLRAMTSLKSGSSAPPMIRSVLSTTKWSPSVG